MTPQQQIADIEAVEHPRAAELLLHPLRQTILHEAHEPASAAEIARRVGLPAQKVNYHVRALVDAGLLVPAGERLKRNLVEKRYRATARAYVLSPEVLGEMNPERLSLSDEVGAAHLIRLASSLQSELARAIREGRDRGGEVPTLSLDVELRFESSAQRAEFATALRDSLADLVGRFTAPAVHPDGVRADGRPYRLVVGCYPIGQPAPGEPRSPGERPRSADRAPREPRSRQATRARSLDEPDPSWQTTGGHTMSNESEPRHTGREIRDEILIEAPPEVVYQAWADPETVQDWFVSRAEGRMEPGETVYWSWDVEGEGMTHRVVRAEPPRRIVLELGVPQGLTLLEITIEQQGGHSLLRLVQSGFGDGAAWDDQYDGMLSGWMVALAILKHFAERYFERKRTEIMVLNDAEFDREGLLELQRTEAGLSRWLTRSGTLGEDVGDPVRLVFADGRTLSGTILRKTPHETLWSWDEIEGVLEIKAFRGPAWGSKVGVRVMSWLDDASDLADLKDFIAGAVGKLATLLG